MSQVIVYVEGGGDTRGLQAPLREGFHKFFRKVLGDSLPRPKVVACGGRQRAFDDFVQGLKSNPGADCVLLVDSEEAVVSGRAKWEHVRQRQGDHWTRPSVADETQLHLMVQAMETWLVADPEALSGYYGKDFRPAALPRATDLETVPKLDVYRALANATGATKKGVYGKAHGFELIGRIDWRKVQHRCPRAGEFFDALTLRVRAMNVVNIACRS